MTMDPIVFGALVVMSFGVGMSFAANVINYAIQRELERRRG